MYNRQQPPAANNANPRNARASQPQNGVPRLELKDLPDDGTKKLCKIEWAGEPKVIGITATWAVVSLKLVSANNAKAKRMYTLGDNNPCLDALEDAWGKDETAWVGKLVNVWKTKTGIQEKEYVRFGCIGDDGKTEIPFNYDDAAEGADAVAAW